jgi:hypothetical protein
VLKPARTRGSSPGFDCIAQALRTRPTPPVSLAHVTRPAWHHPSTAHPYGAEALRTPASTPTSVTVAELQQFVRTLRQITGELAAIHRRLARVLADVTEPGQIRTDADDVAQVRESGDGQRLLRRLELAIDVMCAELERIEQRGYDH